MINDLDELGRTDSNTRYLSLLCKIVMSENDFNITTGFKLCRNVDEMRTLLTKCKFLLWRLEYGKPTMGYEELSAWVLSQNNSNSQSINLIAQAFVLDKENLQISGHCYGEKKNNVVIYGADELSLTYLDLNFNHYGSIDDTINLVGIADHNFVQLNNNPSDIFYKYRHLFEYKQILSISDVYDLYEAGKVDYVFIGVCDDDYRRIYNQLCELGIPVLNEYILSSELQDNLLEQNVYDDISVSVLSDMYAYSQSGLHITWMYNSSKKIVKETYVSEARAGSLQTWFCLFDYMKNVVEVDECCVLSRDWSFNYWHFTFETMSKVHMLEENGYKGMYMFYESASARELVKLYSLDEERIIWIDCNTTSNCYHIKRMCCVEAIGGEADRNAKLLAGFSSKILENLVWDMDIEKYPKRIFIKRIGIRKLKENKDLFEKYGFVTIIPEDLTVEEQIKHFHAADIIINPHGAGSTNCIYMRKGSHFIETFGCNYIQPLCYEILKERKINYHMLVERKNVLKENGPHTSDYEIEDIAFELILQNIFDC
ncbi:MAG: glycosyltransferase family 61 protein [Lachnospiraceae bacterium]|nr:glycosyltransferase family 61 protein [Lachnospiraceae bacterium]